MLHALAERWPEYCIEASLLGLFMVSACVFVVLLHHPDSPLARRVRSPIRKRAIIGLAMGLTAVALIASPLGKRSGAHMNPGVTLTQLVLGRVRPWDALFYILAQFLGGIGGVRVASVLLGGRTSHEAVRHAATLPGPRGARVAWIAEFIIAFILMLTILGVSNHACTAPYTPLFAGALVASFIVIEAPLSGMSMNPARTLGSALASRQWRGLWVYFTAPPLAMLAAAGVYTGVEGTDRVYCAKLDHFTIERCIFNCRIEQMPGFRASLDRRVGIQEGADAHPRR